MPGSYTPPVLAGGGGGGGGAFTVGNDVDVTETTVADGSGVTPADPTKATWISVRFVGNASGGQGRLGSNDDTFVGLHTVPASATAQIDFICKAGESYFVQATGTVTVGQAIERSLG